MQLGEKEAQRSKCTCLIKEGKTSLDSGRPQVVSHVVLHVSTFTAQRQRHCDAQSRSHSFFSFCLFFLCLPVLPQPLNCPRLVWWTSGAAPWGCHPPTLSCVCRHSKYDKKKHDGKYPVTKRQWISWTHDMSFLLNAIVKTMAHFKFKNQCRLSQYGFNIDHFFFLT